MHRRYHHDELTFSLVYAFTEQFVLPLSHDEVVHGKGSLLSRMPGDDWQQHANLRALYAYMWAHPGKKLLFMGGELAQEQEWSHERSLDWHLLERPPPRRRAAAGARPQPPLPRRTRRCGSSTPSPAGFRWLVVDDRDANVRRLRPLLGAGRGRWWRRPTSRRSRARRTACRCPAPGAGARC